MLDYKRIQKILAVQENLYFFAEPDLCDTGDDICRVGKKRSRIAVMFGDKEQKMQSYLYLFCRITKKKTVFLLKNKEMMLYSLTQITFDSEKRN